MPPSHMSSFDHPYQPDKVLSVAGEEYVVERPLKDYRPNHQRWGHPYLCREWATQQPVIIKVYEQPVLASRAQEAAALWQIYRERLIAAGFPDTIASEGKYKVIEFIPGIDMEKPEVTIREIRNMLLATIPHIDTLMNLGLVHADIKTDNILIRGNPPSLEQVSPSDVTLLDFDYMTEVHKQQDTRLVFGTAAFMAPEHFKNMYERTTDVFGFGMSGMHLLGSIPDGISMSSLLPDLILDIQSQRVRDSWPPPKMRTDLERRLHPLYQDVRRELDQILNFIFACIQKDHVARPQSGEEMRQILEDTGNLTEL